MKKAREGYKMTELGEIPEDWEVKKITDVAEINPNYKLIKGEPYDYIDMASLPTETRKFGNISIRKYGNISGSKFKNGDILFARITPCTENGKIGFVDCLNSEYGIGSTEFIVLSPKDCQVEPSYLYYYVKTNIVRSYAINRMIGTTGRQRVPNEVFREELSIPIPSLKEQRKIADILSTVDEHIEETECLIEKTKELKKGLMQRLLTKGIGHTRFKKTEVGEIPVEWKVGKLESLCKVKNEKYNPVENENMRYIALEHIEQGTGRINGIGNSSEATSMKSVFKKGDILFGKLRPYLRKYWYAEFDGVCATEILPIITKQNHDARFCYYIIQQDDFIEYVDKGSFGTKMPRTSWNEMKEFIVPIPPLEEQQKIADILSTVDEQLRQYESQKENLKRLKNGLMQKLLTGKIRVKV